MGGKTQQIQTTNKIADSFPGMDGYVQAPVPQPTTGPVSVDLTKPPKWLRRPVGASFGDKLWTLYEHRKKNSAEISLASIPVLFQFGGKLITFENNKAAIARALQNSQPGQPTIPVHRTVQISQVVTELEFVQKSEELEKALEYGHFSEYCFNKAEVTNNQHKKYIWHFLKANFGQEPRAELLNLLGYKIEDVNSKLDQFVGKELQNNELADDFSNMNRLEDYASGDPFNAIAQQQEEKRSVTPFIIKTGDDTEGLITQALLLNNVEAAVALCLKAKRFADALIVATTAMVSEDWGSIINNCELSSWKEALAAALTHASNEDLPVLCEQLGNRLEIEGRNNPKLAQDAQLCYICSGNFEKLVSSWSGNAVKSTADLQDLVELVTFLQKAIETQGRKVQITGALADLLYHYAFLLASQGYLSTALTYLGSTQNEKVSSLRDRLYIALGQKPSYVQEARQQQSRRGSQRQSFTNYPSTNNFNNTNPFHSNQNQFPATAPQSGNQFNQSQFNTGLPNPNAGSQPWQVQPAPSVGFGLPPTTFSPAPQAPPPSQPPRPTSVGSAHGGSSGLPSRKYILDPSVTSNQYGSTRNQFPTQSIPAFQNNTYSGTPYSPPPINPDPLNPHVPSSIPLVPNPSFNSAPLMPNSSISSAPLMPGLAYGSPAPPTSSLEHTPIERARPALNSFSNAPSGWNDPPPCNKPVRHQVYNPAPLYPQNPPTMYQPPSSTPAEYGQTFNPGNFNQNALPGLAQQPQVVQEIAKPETPQPIQKAPIPEEHIHMQTVFDELKYQCSCAANNPQTKRKLEDVGRKLESLYDLLREHKLSSNTLSSLHQMVQLVQNGNYTGGLNLHTQLVSGPDFSQIASFMPGLKVLLQCALQLQVYLR
ncbi:hypothetical protein NQ314_006562 [Rhamnusium bicolor]|uniref:Protein transport protein Sec31A n=1 Tax=Rhamnusium bicolor TaxID=1586634 RepID=A0AAV8Z022_9CUCU|nr:hypothetical protein NQ314_006562 [Rhamnusium bicolor]